MAGLRITLTCRRRRGHSRSTQRKLQLRRRLSAEPTIVFAHSILRVRWQLLRSTSPRKQAQKPSFFAFVLLVLCAAEDIYFGQMETYRPDLAHSSSPVYSLAIDFESRSLTLLMSPSNRAVPPASKPNKGTREGFRTCRKGGLRHLYVRSPIQRKTPSFGKNTRASDTASVKLGDEMLTGVARRREG